MSNVSIVNPFANAAEAAADGIQECVSAVAEWLSATTDAEQAAGAQLNAMRRRERLSAHCSNTLPTSPHPPAIPLHLRDPGKLVLAARKLGYRVAEIAPLQEPNAKTADVSPPVLLEGADGQRIAIQATPAGHLTVHTSSDIRHIRAIVRQHTLDRAKEHLRQRGMSVRVQTRSTGDIDIIAKEREDIFGDGKAAVTARVTGDGRVRVDVDDVRSNRCEKISDDLAEAVGGKVTRDKKKDSYWLLPGGPTRVGRRIRR